MRSVCETSSRRWYLYFQQNAKKLLSIPWDASYTLSKKEQLRVVPSVQQFELGESSEGETFRRKAFQYARVYDPDYMDALDLFIKEEQRHSKTLRLFLHSFKAPTLTTHWIDDIFRRLRRVFDIEMEIIVLLVAETIAMIYYSRLKIATNSPVLSKICEQILRDETQHINFQSSSLFKVRKTHSYLRNHIAPIAHASLLFGTTCLVWWQHYSVMSYGNYSFSRFIREVFLVFQKSHLVAMGKA